MYVQFGGSKYALRVFNPDETLFFLHNFERPITVSIVSGVSLTISSMEVEMDELFR